MGGDPACDVDAVSNTHVLFQIKSRLYKYCVYDYNGVLKQDRFYLPAGDVPPRLHRDPDIGRIMILGGRIGVPGIDFALTDTQGDEALNNQRRQLREADREAPAVGTDGVQAPASGRGDEQPAAAPATGPVIEKKKGWGRLRFWDRSQP
jgi:hypothetical protein